MSAPRAKPGRGGGKRRVALNAATLAGLDAGDSDVPALPSALLTACDDDSAVARRGDARFAEWTAAQPQPPRSPDLDLCGIARYPAAHTWGRAYIAADAAAAVASGTDAAANEAFARGFFLWMRRHATESGCVALQTLLADKCALEAVLANAVAEHTAANANAQHAQSKRERHEDHAPVASRDADTDTVPKRHKAAPVAAPAAAPPPAVEQMPLLESAPAPATVASFKPPSGRNQGGPYSVADVPRYRHGAVGVHAVAPALSSPHCLREALREAMQFPKRQLVMWIAPPPERLVRGAIAAGFVVRASGGSAGTLGPGAGNRPSADASNQHMWPTFLSEIEAMRKLVSHNNAHPSKRQDLPTDGPWHREAQGGSNILFVASSTRQATPPPVVPKLLHSAIVDHAALVRIPFVNASNAASTYSYAVAEATTLLDAGRAGFGVPVNAIVFTSIEPQAPDTVSAAASASASAVECKYQLTSVLGNARCGDVAKFLAVDATTPVGGHSFEQRAAVLHGLRQAVFDCSARRMWLFDFRLENFVVFGATPTLGSLAPADVRAIDLDPDACRRLHVRQPAHLGGGWTPWITERTAADQPPPENAAERELHASELQRCTYEGWRPCFLLNALLVTAVTRHKLQSEELWRQWWSPKFALLMETIRADVKAHLAVGFGRAPGFGNPDEPRRKAYDPEFDAAARVVQQARWTGSFDPDQNGARRDPGHDPALLGHIARDMLRYYCGSYMLREAEARIFRPLYEAHKRGTLVPDPPAGTTVARAFAWYDSTYRNHYFPCVAHFASRLREPDWGSVSHSSSAAGVEIVDVVLAYARASQAELSRCGEHGLLSKEAFAAAVCQNPAELDVGEPGPGQAPLRNSQRAFWLGLSRL